MPRRTSLFIVLFAALYSSCQETAKKERAIGDAYAGALTLNIRQEITPNSKVVASLKHGDHLEILQVKRRWVRVRTRQGAEGWTDQRQLMSTAQMKELPGLAARPANIPAMGKATVYSTLNIHSEPNRFSPSVYQI